MMKKHIKLSAAAAVILGIGGVLFALFSVHAANTSQSLPTAMPAATAVASPISTDQPAPIPCPVVSAKTETPANSQSGVLDQSRQFALGMIETGNDDREVGGAGEVSRYQIMPVVWHQFSDSQSYRNPATSQLVAQQLWAALYKQFKQQAHREPTDFDMYVLWNTRYGYYAGKGFNPVRLGPTVRERAQRFVNLVERADNDREQIREIVKS